ncbi:DUF3164 family protein [Flavobacterium beibuense]|uniref:DUF3164 family protein n=1 Tax=Flavobacterium beibuense TaxID=657326 RepID=UPI003A90F074
MNNTQKSVTELEAELRAAKEAQRIAYETLKTETVETLCLKAIELNGGLIAFKKLAFDSMQTVWELLKEYSARHNDGKGNFKIEHGDFRVSYKRQGRPTFDERSHQAEKHIIDFVNSKFEDDKDTRDLIMSLLERKAGELDINLIQKLYQMENRFNDENWKKGIELLKESYSYSHSKDYINFEQRDKNGEWQGISLQFSNLNI